MDWLIPHLMQHGEYFLRILIAGFCGAIIGYERKNRMKEAGIRTHLIVAIGSALMMVVSKYGFADILAESGKADASRIASQIVTGVGFLGAGTIFVRKNAISGLTTAAGIWATAGIGMAIGSGMYSVGIASSVTIILIQFIFHGHIKIFEKPSVDMVTFRLKNKEGVVDNVRERLKEENIEIMNIRMDKSASGGINLEVYVKFPPEYHKDKLIDAFVENDNVRTVEY